MRSVYLVNPRRTAVGKAFRGGLARKRPDDFGAELIRAIMSEVQFDPALVEDVIIGCAMPEAEQGMNVARFISLLAGLPESVPAVTVNRFCSSGLQSIAMAAERIMSGQADCIIAGGTESMTLVPMMGHKVVGSRTINQKHPEFYLGMGLTAENVARDYGVSREDQDAFAYESHQKAVNAIASGHFTQEVVPITTEQRQPDGNGGVRIATATFAQDDGPRADTSREALAALKPAFQLKGSVTAGNSSQMSDGAGACLVVSEDFLNQHQLTPAARFVAYSVAGVPPRVMGIGPVAAIPKVLKHGGITLSQVDRIELNEAFAAQAIAVIRELKLDPAKVNPSGGAIALGHPLGATGAKLAATLIHGLKREKQRYGLVTMCIGTGMGAAGLFEAL